MLETQKLRHLVKEVSGRDISTEQAQAFLDLFGEQLEARRLEAARNFVGEYFGARNKILVNPRRH